jgi:thiamine pyrophosphokinase
MSQSKPHSIERIEKLRQKVIAHGEAVLLGPLATSFPEEWSHLPIIGVDGGACLAEPARFDFTLGDGDSLIHKVELDQHFSPQKSQSDLALALSILPLGPWRLQLLGFGGGRLDHQMMNLGELSHWLARSGGSLTLALSPEERLLGFAPGEFQLEIRGLFSLFSPHECRFSIAGDCHYPLEPSVVTPLSSQLLSNFGEGIVTISSSEPFFCYLGAK